MNSRVDHSRNQSSAGDVAKYVIAGLLVVAGLVAFYWFDGQWPTPLRVLAVVAGVASGLVVFLTSAKGLQLREFLSEARFELRKVVWPTRQEAMRMTWVVMLVVVIISLLLAGFDLVIQWVIRLLLGN
ncbi:MULTISPECIES: preprotein translocase subunit SecE [unclassified Luteimonas]|uniref:preprotein translocase subunit SecE n=1 Tax=unclassified Luteimonas TaxID=2629088 RepID=UPI0015FF3E6D|nr:MULTISPECIES: preprotein translocase subunit SecE [unclassified Luteimonas]MBB1473927.1 preprotein translocase subunit SecE [Luteimonas sp. MC1782]MBB6600620.1 preprotein translocase subunit SecE [Luteimonas sp. MC1825]QOC87562.1 preprotein translocase subunit SecE [Luteimonas sp. MC1825]